MATVTHYEMHLGTNSYYVASNPQLSPMYDKSKKSWSQRLKITKTEKLQSPTSQQINEFATFDYGPSGALSRSMKYAEPWLYSTVRGIPAGRPTLHYHHNGHPAIFAPIPAEVAVVICSCPEYLTGTKRDVKKASICKKCKGSRLPLAPIGGTVRIQPTSAPIMHQQRISAATLRLPSSTKSRPSILDTQNDPYDMMRRTRLLSPDSPRESLKISNSRLSEKNSSSSGNSKNQNGTMSKAAMANRGRSRYRSSTGTNISSGTTSISNAGIISNVNTSMANEQDLHLIAKTATIRSRSASRGKQPQSQKALRDRWSDAGGELQIDPGGRRSILECNVNPYELISCGTMNANNEFSPPDNDDMFDIPTIRMKNNSSDAVAIAAAAAAALIKEQKNSSANKVKKLGYSNIQAIAGQRIVLGEQKIKSKLIVQNGENFLYEDIEVQAQILPSPSSSSGGNNSIVIENKNIESEKLKQNSVSFSSGKDEKMSPIEFMADGKSKYHPKRPPRKKQENLNNNSTDEDIEPSVQNNNIKSSYSSSENTVIIKQSAPEQHFEITTPTTPTTPTTTQPVQKSQTIKSILKRPSSVSSQLSTNSSISDNDAKNTINQTSSTSFKSYINQSGATHSDSVIIVEDDNTGTTNKKILATGNSLKKSSNNQQNNEKSTRDQYNGTKVSFSNSSNNISDSCNTNGISNNKRNSGGNSGSQFYLPMPSQQQPSRKKVQFMVEDKIIQDDPEDDFNNHSKNHSEVEFENSHIISNGNNVSFIQMEDNDIKENLQSNDYFSMKNNHTNIATNEEIFTKVNGKLIKPYNSNDNDVNNDDISNIKNKNKFNTKDTMNKINNGNSFDSNQDSNDDEQSCQQLLLMLEQQKMQSQILDILQKQTNHLLQKNSMDLNNFNETNESENDDNNKNYSSANDSNRMNISLDDSNEITNNDLNKENKSLSSIISDKPNSMNLSNWTALRRTHSDRRTNLTGNTMDSSHKIQLQFNDTMALRLKNNRTVATQDLFTQEQQQQPKQQTQHRKQNDNNLNSKDEQPAIQQNQQNILYRPKEPPPPPPPSSSSSLQSMTTESTAIVQNDSSSSSIFEQNYENDKNNGDESSLLLEMHSNELLQMVDSSIKKPTSSSTSSSSSVSTSTLESEIKSIGKTNNNRNSLQKNKNNTNNSYCIDANNRNENNCNNSSSNISKKNIDKTKTATTKPPEHNQSALQSSIVSQSQSKGIQKQQQQQPSKLLQAQQQQKQQKRHSLEQQNVQSDQKSVKITRTPSKESLKGASTTKPKRVSWPGSSEKIQENLITKDSITKKTSTTTGDNIKEKSKLNNGVTLKSILSTDVNEKNSRASNGISKDLLKNGQQQQQQNNRPARPTSLPLTINNVNGTKSLTEERKLIQAQNEISTGARLFGSSNTFLLNSSSLSSSNVTSTLPPPLHQQQPQRTVVRVAPFNTTTTTTTPNSTKKSGEIHRLKIKHTDDTNHNGISNGSSIDDSNGINLNNINSDNGSSFNNSNNQKKTSILINGDDCYSTVNVSNDTSIYQSSVVVTDGTSSSSSTPVLSLTTSKNSPPITNNNMNTENKNNISKYYPSNTVTINVNSDSRSSSNSKITDIKADTSLLKNNNKNKESTNFESSITTNTNKRSLEDEIIYQNNKLNTLLSMNASKSIIPINVNLKTEVNKDITNTFGDTDGNNGILNENYENKNNLKSPTTKRGKTTLITLDFEKLLISTSVASTSMESNNNDKNSDFVNGGFSNSHENNNFSHEEELVKILRNPVEAVKRNLVPHVCGKSDPINSTFNIANDDNSSTISTASRTSSTSTLATVLDDPLMTRSLNREGEYSSNNLEGFLNGSSSSSKSDRHSLVGRLLEDPTLSHLADGLESDVIVRLIESSLKRLKENRNSIDTSGTKDDEDMTKLIDISLQKIKEERHKIETAQHQQNGTNSSLVPNSNVSTHTNNNKSAIEDQQESQSNRGSISSGNSYTSANYELFEFDTNNESDCYQSCSSEITNCDEETISTQSKFYQMLVDATLSEIEITANNDDEHHYESIRVNSDPIYEEISEIPPPLPLSPPPVNETDFERKSSKSMFEGASKYDILSYLVDAKERGIVKEDNFDYTFTSGINDIILEEDRISDNNSSNGNAVNKDLRNPRNHSQNNNSINGINSGSGSGNINITKNSNNGDISSRNSHLSITSESSEDTHSLSSSINEKLLSPSNSATNTLSSIGSQRSKTATIDIERNDSGVGSETSKSSRSKYQQQHPLSLSPTSSAGCLLDKNSPIHLCEDCDGPVETQITESGVMFAPLVCRKCGKKRAERKEIITEIVETEEKYGRDLQIILEEFCQPMLVAGLLTQEQLSAIFLNTEELLENNQTLAERMRDALDISLEQGDDDLLTVNIGKIFLESTQMLHAFESYCVRQAAASLLLANLEKEKELLRIFLRVSQMENTVLRRMNLNSFLMVPVQRVTKYPLLLARLYKVTPGHLEGRELLKQSQEKIELHLNHMNQEAKDVPTKLWRRISSSSPNRRASCEIDMINIKLRKMAIDVLEWNHDEVRFTMEGKLLFTQPTDSNWKKGRTIKLTPVNALLVTNGKPSSNYKSDKAYVDQLHFPKHTGIREASLLLVKEKCGRYTLIREPLYMDRCIICTEADWDDYFEVHEISSKDTFIFKAEDGVRTKHWYKQLQYHSQGMGAWRKRRNALANIMINGMLSRT